VFLAADHLLLRLGGGGAGSGETRRGWCYSWAMQQQLGRSTSGPWTNHLREAARRASTPQPTLSASSLQEEYDPEAPALARVSSTHDEYDPEQPALERHGADEYDPAGTGQPTEEYDPAAPALARQGSGPEEEYDPAAPAAVAYEPLASRSDSFGAGASTPPGPGEQSPRSPAGSDEDEDTDRGRGKQSERGQHRSGSDAPPGRGPAAAGLGAARRGVVAADVALRHTAAALEAICRTVRLSEESWYKWGEAGEARLSGAKPLARGLLDQDLLGQLLRDPNVASELRWLLEQVIPTPLHVLGRISPIFSPVFPRFLRVFTVSTRRFQRAQNRNPGPRNSVKRAQTPF